MSLPNSVNAPVEKQQTNVYTMMLILSFIFIVTACVMLYIELNQFGPFPWWDTRSATQAPTAPAAPAAAPAAPAAAPAPAPAAP